MNSVNPNAQTVTDLIATARKANHARLMAKKKLAESERVLAEAIDKAREGGATWEEIGQPMGYSRASLYMWRKQHEGRRSGNV